LSEVSSGRNEFPAHATRAERDDLRARLAWESYLAPSDDDAVRELAIAATTPTTLYAGTEAGVFSLQQVAVCGGDCNMDAQATVDEVLTLVNIALGTADLLNCPAGDANHDNQLTINEIIAAVEHALNGCVG
jgi:hypothetical protein